MLGNDTELGAVPNFLFVIMRVEEHMCGHAQKHTALVVRLNLGLRLKECERGLEEWPRSSSFSF